MSELFIPVDDDVLDSLGSVISEGRYPTVPQDGPVRWFDTEKRCASRGCSGPTHCSLKGIPYCMKHIITKLNEMLIELGVTK